MRLAMTFAAALLSALPAAAQAPAAPMSLEQIMLLRCSAAFAIGAGQGTVDPALVLRGREYFVRASARLMDELKLTREEMTARLRAEVATQQQAGAASGDARAYSQRALEPCMIALGASGL